MRLTSSSEQGKVDLDGLVMLAFSIVFFLATLGLSYLVTYFYSWRVTRQSSNLTENELPVFVFGYQLIKNKILPPYQQRLEKLLSTSELFGNVFLLGGRTHDNQISEAEAGKKFILAKNPSLESRLILETSSRNTLENLKQARKFMRAHNLPLKTALLTHRYHLARCQVMAKGLGFETVLVPVEQETAIKLNEVYRMLLESFYIHWYYTGLVLGSLIRSQRILNKIK